MKRPPPPSVVILARNAAIEQRWAAALLQAGIRVWNADSDVPEGVDVDLCLTDTADDAARVPEAGLPGGQGLATTEISRPDTSRGIIAVGCDRAADVRLADDATDREIVLACGLLAEVVRLRRQQCRQADLEQKLSRLALSDPLTGLPNRRAWDEQFAVRREEAAARGDGLCVVLLDLDHFKRVNDQYGHTAGDRVLRAAAEALKVQIRRDDFVARLGGDEFGVLLLGVTTHGAATVVERIRVALGEQLATCTAESVTASAGYAVASGQETGVEPLYETASAALQAAKQGGRDRSAGPP